MTPSRPIYQVSVANVSQGWTHTIEHRETPPAFDDVTILLVDSLTMGWSITNGQVPGPLDPDDVTLNLYAKTVTDVPAIEVGDIVQVNLDRPTASVPIPYMHFTGRITDATATTRGAVGIQVTAVGLAADLAAMGEVNVDNGIPDTEFVRINPLEWVTGMRVLDSTPYNFVSHWPYKFNQNVAEINGAQTLPDLLDAITAAGVDDTGRPVLRLAYDWTPPGIAEGWIPQLNEPFKPSPYMFYLQQWDSQITAPVAAPLRLALSPVDPTMVSVEVEPVTASPGAVVLDASLVDAAVSWTKQRGQIVNSVKITGYTVPGAGPATETEYTASDPGNIASYGPTTREVATHAPVSDFPAASLVPLADAYLGIVPDRAGWDIPQMTIRPDLMSDDELDGYAPQFYPHVEPVPSVLGRHIIVVDVDQDIALNGRLILAQITGCTFNISGGRLTITPTLSAVATLRLAPGVSPSFTYNQMAASTWATTTYQPAGGLHIDPALTWNELNLTTL